MIRFIDRSIPDRIRVLMGDKDVDHIYEILEKHWFSSIDTLRSKFKITFNKPKRFILIEGSDMTDIFELFQYLTRFGIRFEAVGQNHLRLDVYEFLTKLI